MKIKTLSLGNTVVRMAFDPGLGCSVEFFEPPRDGQSQAFYASVNGEENVGKLVEALRDEIGEFENKMNSLGRKKDEVPF